MAGYIKNSPTAEQLDALKRSVEKLEHENEQLRQSIEMSGDPIESMLKLKCDLIAAEQRIAELEAEKTPLSP